MSKRVGCSSNQRQIGISFTGFQGDNNGRFPFTELRHNSSAHSPISWDDKLAPYDGRGELSPEVAKIDFLHPNNYSGRNSRLYLCPASPFQDPLSSPYSGHTGYRISYVVHASANSNSLTGEYNKSDTSRRGISHPAINRNPPGEDDPSKITGGFGMPVWQIPKPGNSIALFERHIAWQDMGRGYEENLRSLRTTHADNLDTSLFPKLESQWVHGKIYAMNFLFADGSVRFLDMDETVSPNVTWYSTNTEKDNGMWDCQPDW